MKKELIMKRELKMKNNYNQKLNYYFILPYLIKNSMSCRALNTSVHSLYNKSYKTSHNLNSNTGDRLPINTGDFSLVEIIVGSLLGNSYMKKNKLDNSIIISFVKCSNNIEYLMWFHKLLVEGGFVKQKKPKLKKVIFKKNKVLYTYIVDSYKLYNVNWLYEIFYNSSAKKIIPNNFYLLLTPLSLTIWYLENNPKMLNLEPSKFEIKNKDLDNITNVFKEKYNIEIAINLENKNIVIFYIKKKSINTFSDLISPHLLPSFMFKLRKVHNKLTLFKMS